MLQPVAMETYAVQTAEVAYSVLVLFAVIKLSCHFAAFLCACFVFLVNLFESQGKLQSLCAFHFAALSLSSRFTFMLIHQFYLCK